MGQAGFQTEAELEEELLGRLHSNGYERIIIKDEDALKGNLRRQIDIHNKGKLITPLTDSEFDRVLHHLNKGNIFDRAHTLREKMALKRDGEKEIVYIEFINKAQWCKNTFQVTNQVTVVGKHKNRYDVTILINGLPLVQIELKKRGIAIEDAFNQTGRYNDHSYSSGSGLFSYIQLFVISNGANTKYYANVDTQNRSLKQTFFWADSNKNQIAGLIPFADVFLDPCFIAKMITQYIILHSSDKKLYVLRSYQYHAAEAILEKVKAGRSNGYVWHTTGSGKTLTSFKAANLVASLDKIHKVFFVVDRQDLDSQTIDEFNNFSKGCVDTTINTGNLIKQIKGDNDIIVTTIQKLDRAIKSKRYSETIKSIASKRVVFIFDECHRGLSGKTNNRINGIFNNPQMFGFTGTPIFDENVTNQKTTISIFDECLHKYLIQDAIRDDNVLKFMIEYYDVKPKHDSTSDGQEIIVSDASRISENVKDIVAHHSLRTKGYKFTSILCVQCVADLHKYYEALKHTNLKIAAIFSYKANQEMGDPDDQMISGNGKAEYDSDMLASYINDYNNQYETCFSLEDVRAYKNNISRRMKCIDRLAGEDVDIDILIVVNMFLTGFDSKWVNTLYVDKKLKYHGLIQAFSRTNRTCGVIKSHGNIICYQTEKEDTDEAIKLFSNNHPEESVTVEKYAHYVERFNDALKSLREISPTVDDVNGLGESDRLNFVKTFKSMLQALNTMETFSSFTWKDLNINEQEKNDYQSKYLDIYKSVKSSPDVNPLDPLQDIDFEVELTHQDLITVDYIMELIKELKGNSLTTDENEKRLLSIISSDILFSDRQELFIDFYRKLTSHDLSIDDGIGLKDMFIAFLEEESVKSLKKYCDDNQLIYDGMRKTISIYVQKNTGLDGMSIHKLFNNGCHYIENKGRIDEAIEYIKYFVCVFCNGV